MTDIYAKVIEDNDNQKDDVFKENLKHINPLAHQLYIKSKTSNKK